MEYSALEEIHKDHQSPTRVHARGTAKNPSLL